MVLYVQYLDSHILHAAHFPVRNNRWTTTPSTTFHQATPARPVNQNVPNGTNRSGTHFTVRSSGFGTSGPPPVVWDILSRFQRVSRDAASGPIISIAAQHVDGIDVIVKLVPFQNVPSFFPGPQTSVPKFLLLQLGNDPSNRLCCLLPYILIFVALRCAPQGG